MGKIVRQIDMALSGLHVREAEGEKESRVIEGHAVVWGQRSVNLTPWSDVREVYEVMEVGSIDEELINRSDVVLTAYHDNSKIMGRSVNGKGTLQLSIDEVGVMVRCELAKTQDADDALELIRRGDVSGMSFCYTCDEEHDVEYVREEERSADGKDVYIRTVKKCNGLYDVTIAGHPAYQGTDISNREAGEEAEKRIDAQVEDQQKREAQAQAEADENAKKAREIAKEARNKVLSAMQRELDAERAMMVRDEIDF